MKRCMKTYGGSRPKAFWGAVIGAATSLIGGALSSSSQRKQALAQKRLEEYAAAKKIANSADAVNQSLAAEEHYQEQFRQAYKIGGRKKLRNEPIITDGGNAIPLGHNTFLLRGGSHEDINETGNTGIGIDVNGYEIEAEGGEVAQNKANELRIFSKEPILPGGISPAEAVIAGANKDYVFKQQEEIKNLLGVNDEGEPIAEYGNLYYLTAPQGQQMIANGITNPAVINRGLRQPITGIDNLARFAKLLNAGAFGGVDNPNKVSNFVIEQGNKLVDDNKKAIEKSKFSLGGKTTRPVEGRRKARLGDNYWYLPNTRMGNFIRRTYNSTDGQVASQSNATPSVTTPSNPTVTNTANVVVPTRSIPSLKSVVSPDYSYGEGTRYTGQISPDWFDENGRPYNNIPVYNGVQMATRQADGSYSFPEVDIQPNPVLKNPDVEAINADKTLAIGDNYEGPKTTVDLDTTIDGRTGRDRMGMIVKGGDWIGLGADLLGSIGLGWINANSAKRGYQVPDAPGYIQAAKLNTTYNINPQLADNERNRLATNRSIARDTISSVASLARQGVTNTNATSIVNQLYGEKENKENEYINADAMNQQEVAAKNIALQQDWREKANAIRNEQARAKAQARQISLQGISGAAGNFLGQTMQRYEDVQALKAYIAASEEGTGARMVAAGLDDTGELSKTGLLALQGKIKPLDGLTEEQRKIQEGYRQQYKVMYNNLNKTRHGRRWMSRNNIASMPTVW